MNTDAKRSVIDTVDRLQPVLMLGPRNIGKSALISRVTDPVPQEARATNAPKRGFVYYFPKRHWPRNPEIFKENGVDVHVEVRPGLEFWDIPGEFAQQNKAFELVRERATEFLYTSAKIGSKEGLGVVIAVFMGGCRESIEKTLSHYSNEFIDELKQQLRVGAPRICVQDVVFIMNKWDLWYLQTKAIEPSADCSPDAMIATMKRTYQSQIKSLHKLGLSAHKGDPKCVSTRLGRSTEDDIIIQKISPAIWKPLMGMEDLNVSKALQFLSISYVNYLALE